MTNFLTITVGVYIVPNSEADQRVTIFCSELQLELLTMSTQIGCDGTFKCCPSLYAQFYIIMGWFKAERLPAAFVLLGWKQKATNHRMIKELQNACLEYNNKVQFFSKHTPTFFDFDTSIGTPFDRA